MQHARATSSPLTDVNVAGSGLWTIRRHGGSPTGVSPLGDSPTRRFAETAFRRRVVRRYGQFADTPFRRRPFADTAVS